MLSTEPRRSLLFLFTLDNKTKNMYFLSCAGLLQILHDTKNTVALIPITLKCAAQFEKKLLTIKFVLPW